MQVTFADGATYGIHAANRQQASLRARRLRAVTQLVERLGRGAYDYEIAAERGKLPAIVSIKPMA